MGGRKGWERGGSSAEEQNRQCYKEPRAATGARGHPRCEAKRLFPGQAGEARRKRDRGEGKRGQPQDVCPSPRRFVRLPSVSGMKAAPGPLPASSSTAGIAFVWLVASSLRREGGIYIKKKGIAKTKRKKKGKPTTTQNAAPAPTPPPTHHLHHPTTTKKGKIFPKPGRCHHRNRNQSHSKDPAAWEGDKMFSIDCCRESHC